MRALILIVLVQLATALGTSCGGDSSVADYDRGDGQSDRHPAPGFEVNGDGVSTWQEFGPQDPTPTTEKAKPYVRYDVDGDGLIEIANLEQLSVMRFDLAGKGRPGFHGSAERYYAAFPVGEGEDVCGICNGYELTRSLDFADPGSYASGVVNESWLTGGWEPGTLGARNSPAIFEGNGHSIRNLNYRDIKYTSTRHDVSGFFGTVQKGSVIRNVSLLDVNVTGFNDVGGLAGSNPGRIAFSFWSTEATGQPNGSGDGNPPEESGKTIAELQSPTGFDGVYTVWNIDMDNADGDFTLETGAGDFWDFGTDKQYPALKADIDGNGVPTWQEFGRQGRDSSKDTPAVLIVNTPTSVPAPRHTPDAAASLDKDSDRLIEVSSLEQLNAIRYDLDGDGTPDDSGTEAYALAFPAFASAPCHWCKGYELTRSLDFQDSDSYASGAPNALWTTGSGWLPIGLDTDDKAFETVFDGNGHTIGNLYVNRTTILDNTGATGL